MREAFLTIKKVNFAKALKRKETFFTKKSCLLRRVIHRRKGFESNPFLLRAHNSHTVYKSLGGRDRMLPEYHIAALVSAIVTNFVPLLHITAQDSVI
jgi:hypothetical protein